MKNYFLQGVAAMLFASSFSMCTKDALKIEKPVAIAGVPKKALLAVTGDQLIDDPDLSFTDIGECSYTVQTTQWYVDGTNIAPGSVICIPAGTRGALLLKNIKGTADNPITIINKGGKVTFTASTTASYGFKTQNCQYFRVLGTGAPGIKYGFDVNGGNIGMTMDALSSDFVIANVEVRNSGFAGIMAKTDPSCDIATQRGNFTMQNVTIARNYIHKTGGEGIYAGNSFYAKGSVLSCGTVLPHDIRSLKVYGNITDSTGCEGIQVGSATAGCSVYNNIVKSPGLSPFASAQNNGIQIGEGTGGRCYNNLVKDAPGAGIIVLGLGDNMVYNNYIIRSGSHGIFADSRYTPGPNFQFINNTIIEPGGDGIKLNSTTIPMNTAINNAIIKPGSGLAIHRMNSSVKLTQANNYVNTDVNSCGFADYNGGDFHLQASSPLISAGADVSSYGIFYDFYSLPRSTTRATDVGATAYQAVQ